MSKQLDAKREVKKAPILKKFAGELNELQNAVSMKNTRVTPENLEEMNQKFKNFIKNDENIQDNIDLAAGDFLSWNEETKTLTVIGDVVQNGMKYIHTNKFQIRFKPETKEEYRRNVRLARKMQDDYEKAHPVKHKKEWKPADEKSAENTTEEKTVKKPKESREDLRQSGKILWDWIVRRGSWPTGKASSCGAAVGNLMNQFGFRRLLPQSGRDGKNWDTIIEKNLSDYFTKIPVSHPDDAPPWSIIVFNEWAWRWKRRTFGHVEIKGSNGRYYHYVSSPTAGGSVHSNKLRGEAYRKYTGFNGYAYVYNGKKPPR